MLAIPVLVTFSTLLVWQGPAQVNQSNNPSIREIERRIRQLGSESDEEQEEAALALKGFGAKALEPLRLAALSYIDPEVRMRAKMLVRILTPHPGQVWCNYAGPWDGDFDDVCYGIECLAFSPDSRHVVSSAGWGPRTIKLWDVATGTVVRRFEGNYDWICCLVFSPDRRFLAALDLFAKGGNPVQRQGSVIFIWEAATGKLVHRIESTWGLRSVAFTDQGKQLVSAGEKVSWWDISTGKELKTFQPKDFLGFWGLSSDGRYVFGDKKNEQHLYDASLINLTEGTELAHFPFKELQVGYTPERNAVLLSGTLRLCDCKSGKDLVQFYGKGAAHDVAISLDGRRALSAHGEHYEAHVGWLPRFNRDCTVRLWDLKTGKELQCFRGHQNPVSCVAFSPDGRYAASGSRYGTLRVWKLPK
jgi:WD40 repeat protein